MCPFNLHTLHLVPQDNINVVSDSLDILFDLLVRFGSLVPSEEQVGKSGELGGAWSLARREALR